MSGRAKSKRHREQPTPGHRRNDLAEQLIWPPAAGHGVALLDLGLPEALDTAAVEPTGARTAAEPQGSRRTEPLEYQTPVPPAEVANRRRDLLHAVSAWATRGRVVLLAVTLLAFAEALFIAVNRSASASRTVPSGPVATAGNPAGARTVATAGRTSGRPSDTAPGAAASVLTVQTEPPGATVTVDDTRRGVAPVEWHDLDAGLHEVTVETRAGPLHQRVRLAAGERLSLVIPLLGSGAARKPPRSGAPSTASGWVAVSAPMELRIFEGDRLLGTSAMQRVPLGPGSHRLLLKSEEAGFEQARAVTVKLGKVASLAVDMPSQKVAVNATPWAEVLVDGTHVGETPIGTLQLPVGPHVLTFRHPQLGEKRANVVIRADAPGRISVDMTK